VTLRTDSRFIWFIADDADTTVRESTDCAYDRFVVAGNQLPKAIKEVAVFNFQQEYNLSEDQAYAVSDHFPIEMKIELQNGPQTTPDPDNSSEQLGITTCIYLSLIF
ncbi:hypothetical protein, partial [Salmonella sp. s55004]|uniref:hypothetical protein n=1 Tax=Salmonella sp. s55004 TaxID=3159675 RepID=UPI00398087C5